MIKGVQTVTQQNPRELPLSGVFCHSQMTNLRLAADYLLYLFFYPLSLSSISSISGMAEIPPRRSTHRLATALPTLPK